MTIMYWDKLLTNWWDQEPADSRAGQWANVQISLDDQPLGEMRDISWSDHYVSVSAARMVENAIRRTFLDGGFGDPMRATGDVLSGVAHEFYDVDRADGETDEALRERMLARLHVDLDDISVIPAGASGE